MNIIENKLYVGEIPASDVVKKFGTPVYVYDEDVIRYKYRELAESISYPKLKIFYAAKANANKKILQILREEKAGISAASIGEILVALNAGFKPNQIMLASPSLTNQEMKFAISKKILINIDSVSQLERYGKLNPRSNVSIRINHAVKSSKHVLSGPDTQFGIWAGNLDQAISAADAYNLNIVGLHHNVGTELLDAKDYINSIDVLLAVAKSFKNLDFINFGGGIGVPYLPDQTPLDINKLGEKISSILKRFAINYGKDLLFVFEPGRYLVAESGVLLCSVNAVKTTPKHTFVSVNTGFNHLLRPALYGSYHPIVNINNVESKNKEKIVVSGNLSDSADLFTASKQGIKDRELPSVKNNDVLAIMMAGAYGYSMSSNYNMHPRPAEILVSGKKMSVIRPAEKIHDLMQEDN
ncbi:diaminopimelate decarboxylase [Candidatus Woesearchaeota archaeon]|nr:diaminopimelate decarboxylase [Candidatus Woesearchaeota archaeon]|tara:strand:+ start:17383 stop:18615 length:1233 start_codon:yes stop_codon:yes gene_type:complete